MSPISIRPLFNRYQPLLVSFANTPMGRAYLRAEKQSKIVKVAPDGLHYWDGGKEIKAVFCSRSPYLKKFDLALRKIHAFEEIGVKAKSFLRYRPGLVIPHFQELRRFDFLPNMMMDELTFNPDAHVETSSVDGRVGIIAVNSSWAAIARGNGSTHVDTEGDNIEATRLTGDNSGNNWDSCFRGVFVFDTSSLGAGVVISATDHKIYVTAKATTHGTPAVALCDGYSASDDDLINSDYENQGTIKQATNKNISALSTGAYNTWALNPTGIANIDPEGASKFCTRIESERANSEPAGADGSDTMAIQFADGTNAPQLVVTYTLPVSGGNPMFFSGGVVVG